MKKVFVGVLAVVISFVFTFAVAEANPKYKIGIVDFQKVLLTSSPGKLATEEMEKEGKKMEADVKSREDEILELQKKLERESLVMGKEKTEEKQRELRIKANDFKSLKASYVKKFKQIQAQHFNKIKNEVLKLAAEMGKKEGYSLIIEKNEAGIMYVDDTVNITDKVIKLYNKTAVSK